MTRIPENPEECELIEQSLLPHEFQEAISYLEQGQFSQKLASTVLSLYPSGVYLEGWGSSSYNDGEFVETTIPLLH